MSGRSWFVGAVLVAALSGVSVVAWANSSQTSGVMAAPLTPRDCASGQLSDGAPSYGAKYSKDRPDVQADAWAKIMGIYDSYPDATKQTSYADDTTQVIDFDVNKITVARMFFGYSDAYGWELSDLAECST
jgi:hypothetical protein